MNLKRKTHRRIGRVKSYGGVCHNCNSPVAYKKSFIVIEIARTAEYDIVVPVDVFKCPYCDTTIKILLIYKNMEVSAEFREMAEKHE